MSNCLLLLFGVDIWIGSSHWDLEEREESWNSWKDYWEARCNWQTCHCWEASCYQRRNKNKWTSVVGDSESEDGDE